MVELGIGISGSLIASIIYNTAKGIYRGFNNSLTRALEDTSIYFAKEENIEFRVGKLRNILQGKVSVSEIEKLRSGNDFIDGDKLAVQFAIFGELYFEDQSDILPIARSILDYFIKRLEYHLLLDPRASSSVLAGYIKMYGEKSNAEHNHIITILHTILERLESHKELSSRVRDSREIMVEGPEKISTAKLPSTSPDLFGREKELKMLDEAWEDENTCVVSLVAFGGVGKTALVNVWLNEMQKDSFRGAERVYGWSFYNQGAREGTQASADEFIADALRWFGDPDPIQGSPWDKGERPAGLMKRRRTLLILDGLEPLQYPPGEMAGRLKDPGLQCLLRELARQNPGLCVVTTRLGLDDLSEHLGASVKRVNLEHLSAEAGMQLLRNLGADGTDDELKQAVHEFDGHALALTLLSKYLAVVYGGDVRHRDRIAKLTKGPKQGGRARRVMESYERWFKGKPELDILHIMGLFDRPAEGGAIEAVRVEPIIEGLTSELVKLSHDDWQFALDNLREARLLAPKDNDRPDSLDCHPLIRKHFGEKLRESNPTAWREAHNRLYEYYQSQAEEYPDTIDGMTPLYAAVAHGCQSGQCQCVLEEIYEKRINRTKEKYVSLTFLKDELGAISADLAILSYFYSKPWEQPADQLTEDQKSFVLSKAGLVLRLMGRTKEAAQPMQVGLERYKSCNNWSAAAQAARHLSQLYLAQGHLNLAKGLARKSINFAKRSGELYYQIVTRANFADILHQTGRLKEAGWMFKKAEQKQKKMEPCFPFLCRLHGFRHFDLLLDLGMYRTVLNRAEQTLGWEYPKNCRVGSALHRFAKARAHLYEAMKGGTRNFSQAQTHLDRSIDGLRKTGQQQYLPFALLGRGELHRVHGDFDQAQRDLDNAMNIANRGGMHLYEADCHLEYARLHLAVGDKHEARESLDTARKMIDEMGYHRRDPEVLLATAHLYILEGKNNNARQILDAARNLINEMGCHRWDVKVKMLEEQLMV